MPTHHHDRRNGAAINDLTRVLIHHDDGRIIVFHDDITNGPLDGADRRVVLARARDAIDAELGDRPAPAGVVPGDGPVPDGRADRGELDILRDDVVDSAALLIRRLSDGVTDVDKRNATKWLLARDR
jgi:hypothetical protein